MMEITPPRPTFATDATEEESAVVGRHFRYLQDLVADGRCLMAGRYDDAEKGFAIFAADSMEEAEALVSADPAVQAGIFTPRVKLFRLALWTQGQPEPG